MDIIEINSLRLRTILGFSAHELNVPQDVVLDLRIGTDQRLAGESDNPEHALNYRSVSKAIIALVGGSRFLLVEKLAEEIARLVLLEFHAPYVQVRLHKPGALRHSDSVGISLERTPEDYAVNVAYLSLGSNISPNANLNAAVRLLRHYTTLLAISPVYRTAPQGFREQAPFLNMAASVHTLRSPIEFKTHVIDRIESELGRVRDPQNRNAPRTIDIDIALWNDEVLVYGSKPWHIPDPYLLRFAHIAVPLADLAPDYFHPGAGKTLSEISSDLDKTTMEQTRISFFDKPACS